MIQLNNLNLNLSYTLHNICDLFHGTETSSECLQNYFFFNIVKNFGELKRRYLQETYCIPRFLSNAVIIKIGFLRSSIMLDPTNGSYNPSVLEEYSYSDSQLSLYNVIHIIQNLNYKKIYVCLLCVTRAQLKDMLSMKSFTALKYSVRIIFREIRTRCQQNFYTFNMCTACPYLLLTTKSLLLWLKL